MIVAADLPAAVGNTPLIRLRRASEATGCEILGQGRVHEPRPVGQGPRGALDHPRRRRPRRAPARRHHRRGHRRQHRHRPRADRRRDGLPHRHRDPRHPEPGEEGHDPARRRRRWSRCRRCPTATRTTTSATPARLAEKLAAADPHGAVWANQFDNVANRQAHIDGTAPEIWEQTGGRIDGFICAVGSGGTLAGRRRRPPRARSQGEDRPRRPLRRGALALLRATAR